MNHRTMRQRVAEQLADRVGWQPHPEQDHHFRHLETGVHILVYGTEINVTFGPFAGVRYDRAVAASFKYFPSLALASALEVADALVSARRAITRDRVLAEAWDKALITDEAGG